MPLDNICKKIEEMKCHKINHYMIIDQSNNGSKMFVTANELQSKDEFWSTTFFVKNNFLSIILSP